LFSRRIKHLFLIFEIKIADQVVVTRPGGRVWDAAIVLATYILAEVGRAGLDGMSVFEIGAGSGLAGIVAALLGANVTVTDKYAVVPLLEINCSTNAPTCVAEGKLRAEPLEWGQRLGGRKRRRRENSFQYPDWILASDVLGCGDAALYPPLLKTLRELCGPSTSILMAYKPRAHFERDFFAAACDSDSDSNFVIRRVGRASLPRDGGGGAGGRTESYQAPIDLLELRIAAPRHGSPEPKNVDPSLEREQVAENNFASASALGGQMRPSLPGCMLSKADFDMYYVGMDR
jgi:predicted nicotinamide N-methyase